MGRAVSKAARGWDGRLACLTVLLFALCLSLMPWPRSAAHAVEAIVVKPELDKIDITSLGELYEGRGDRLQIETAPGQDGYIGRMAVQATTAGTNPGWLVFALSNPTTDRITRWLVAPRYTLANSRVASPELDGARIAAITPSLGFRPERMKPVESASSRQRPSRRTRLTASVVALEARELGGRRRRPMTRCTPTDALSNMVSWRLGSPGALRVAKELGEGPPGVAI